MKGRFLFRVGLFLLLFGTGSVSVLSQTVVRGPYLQQSTPTSIIVRWRTDVATDSRVRYGAAPDQLNNAADDLVSTTEHEVRISNLAPATPYFYSIGTTAGVVLRGGDAHHYFYTAPAPGSEQPVRIWTFGDAQEGSAAARHAVRDAYYNFTAGTRTDIMLLLGDNATFNNVPTDDVYTEKVFRSYADILRNTPIWSTFGNHEGFSAVSLLQTGVYYEAFTFPRNGEAGGAPSGTEAYYSFDYANIHFICLNSHDIPRQEFGAMMNWLRADLAQNRQKWTIAYFHHPPYSRGSHDSDNHRIDTPESAASIREMREIALPILEAAGVDLVLSGHSHTYERSFLLDGHYGTSDTLTDANKIDDGNGRVDGDGAYRKTPDVDADSHAGTVYLVPSTGGNVRNGSLDHPVMVSSMAINGSMVIDVSGDRLDAKFIDSNAANPTVRDQFTIVKTFARGPVSPTHQPIQDDAYPDQVDGKDLDGRYKLSWTYPAPPVEQPCGYSIEESNPTVSIFSDDGEEQLTAGANSRWTSNGDWVSTLHPGTMTNGYTVVYGVEQNSPLTMVNPVLIPAGRSARLTFRSYEDIEEDFDFAFVEVSANGGAFETLATYDGTFSGKREIDLSAYSGQSIIVRFRLTSDIITLTGQLGWFIDDVNIETSNWTRIATTSATSFDVTGRGNGTYLYRVNGLFGDCSTTPSSGPISEVRQITVELGPPTFAPTASFTAAPSPAEVGETVTFDASSSVDNDASGPAPHITNYFWSFGDGATYSSSGPFASHSYSLAGIYRVLLTVTDNEGESASSEAYVVINEPQPNEIHAAGSGHILVEGRKANFGFEAEKLGSAYSGRFEYHDRHNRLKVTGVSVTSVERSGNQVTFTGACTVNKQPGFTFTITVTDDGNGDTFRIQLSNGYDAMGSVYGGEITISP